MFCVGTVAAAIQVCINVPLSAAAQDDEPKNAAAYAARAAAHDARREFDKAVADWTKVIELSPRSIAAYQRRGECHFRLGHFKQSVADFDKVIELEPDREPHHWQRGISLYYAGDFERGRRQFELHRTVNPDDVENAAWHYLCVARLKGAEEATKSLIPVTGDARVPMAQVQALFAGKATADDVLAAARAGEVPPAPRRARLFYAHLYVGLHHDAAGRKEAAKEHVLLAAEKYADDDYMGDVARVHAALLRPEGEKPPRPPAG
jgi:lipoprotein NlpI